MRAMRRYLFKNDLEHWATSFFEALRVQASGEGATVGDRARAHA